MSHNSASSRYWRNVMRISDVDGGLLSEGETMWLLRSSALVFASGCGYFAALVLLCFVLLLGLMVAVVSVYGLLVLLLIIIRSRYSFGHVTTIFAYSSESRSFLSPQLSPFL